MKELLKDIKWKIKIFIGLFILIISILFTLFIIIPNLIILSLIIFLIGFLLTIGFIIYYNFKKNEILKNFFEKVSNQKGYKNTSKSSTSEDTTYIIIEKNEKN